MLLWIHYWVDGELSEVFSIGDHEQTTREKILQAAFELFGQHGFSGTSIREIARLSGVNLAAINYHFKNKENLFWCVMGESLSAMDAKLKELYENSENLEELSMSIYDFMLNESSTMKNAFKMLLTDGLDQPEDESVREQLNNPMGPPGGIYISQMIEREVGQKVPEEVLLWGVKTLFGAMNFWVLLCHSKEVAATCSKNESHLLSPDRLRSDVKLLSNAVLDFIKNQSKKVGNHIHSDQNHNQPLQDFHP